VAFTVGLLPLAACAKGAPQAPSTTDAEVATAIHNCGVPAEAISVVREKDRTLRISRVRHDVTFKQFMCVSDWAQKNGGLKTGLISEELN
jgi:hypothetical protein